ncbi:CBN-EVL-14 protein [Caenorhabditis brenneri]|uniref:CBN-EVL-14 protein n=1 Tax=Caenorhabditis brenneri TaxID=135651 RepID=G0ME25_CAEBE|nr:CBN-EVL-14 protein [Caenorhabditis brenneri]
MTKAIEYPPGCLPIDPSASVSQQIERLRKLSGCLYEYQKEESGDPKFRTLFTHLSQKKFLDNSNDDYRILISNCLASILRIHSPEFPAVHVVDLKDVYYHIFRSLRGLGQNKIDSPKFKQYHHLLDTLHEESFLKPLAEMKDFDEAAANSVNRALIKTCVEIPSEKAWKQNPRGDSKRNEPGTSRPSEEDDDEDTVDEVVRKLVAIGARAIGQLDFVANEILDVLFYHIIPPQRSTAVESRKLAEMIIKECLEQPEENPLKQSIQSLMTSAAKQGKLPDEFRKTGCDNRGKFFEVLRFLHYISFELVAGATQELNFWLRSENELYRREAVIIVGLLTRDPQCQFGMDQNDATWTAFLNASGDTDEQVRHAFVEQSKDILMSNHSHLRGHVINALLRLVKDESDEVRIAVVESVTQVAKSRLEVISDRLLKTCAERMKDKKPKVRERAIKLFMDLYHHVMTSRPVPFYSRDGNTISRDNESSPKYTESDKECVKFIPNHIFHLYHIIHRNPQYVEAKFTIERYIQKNFIPYDLEAKTRVEVMASFFRELDNVPSLMFNDVISRSGSFRRAILQIMSHVSTIKKDDIEGQEQIKERIHKLCVVFPDSTNLEKIWKVFVNHIAENSESYNLMKKIVAEKYTTEEVKTAVELVDLVVKTVAGKQIMKTSAEKNFEKDLELLKIFTNHFAHCFVDETIIDTIREKMLSIHDPVVVETSIHALTRIFSNSALKKSLESQESRGKNWFIRLVRSLKELITRDEPELRRSCKLATRLLASLLDKQSATKFFDGEIDLLLGGLTVKSSGTANSFQVLAEIYRTDPAHYFNKIIREMESDLIGPALMTSPECSEDDPIDFNDLPHIDKQPWPKYTMAKVYAMKFAAIVLSSHSLLADDEQKRQLEAVAQKYIDILCELLEKKGELHEKQCDVEKARLRAAASACLLKLTPIMVYRSKFNTRLFKEMSYMITDEAYCVRIFYAVHVKKGLQRNRLPIEFAACFGLANLGAVEEEGENNLAGFKVLCTNTANQVFAERSEARADIMKLGVPQRAVFCAETVIAYLVWLLANYHKFEKVEDNAKKDDSEEELEKKVANVNLLAELQESLWLVIDALKVAKCNMQKVWKVLEKLKTCGDKPMRQDDKFSVNEMREHNKKMWALCDLGITMMLYRAKLQMQDQEAKEAGFNLQFFYICNERDKADPSNVYAPDILINDEKQRNGRVPKTRRVYKVSDLTAEFTPPPTGNETIASTSLKNTSRRGANTTGNKGKGGGKATKRRSGGSRVSDDEDDLRVSPPVVKKTRSKRGAYDLPEEEDDDDDIEEVMPLPKRRGAPPVSTMPSSSFSSNGIPQRNGTSSPQKRTSRASNGRQNSKRETEIEDDSDEEQEQEPDVSLDNLVISPILNDGRSRRSARTIAATATITSSTPFVTAKPKTIKRKRAEPTEELNEVVEEDDEVEEVPEEPTPKTRASLRSAASTASSARPTRKPTAAPPPAKRATSSRTSDVAKPSPSKSTPSKPMPTRGTSSTKAAPAKPAPAKQTPTKPAPAKAAPSKASPAKPAPAKASSFRASAAAAKKNGASPKKNKFGLPMEEEDEDEEEDAPSTSTPSLRTRTSARTAKK